MFRATGFGKVEAHTEFVPAGVLKALLYNFDFDDFADRQYKPLKLEHQNFLREKVLPLLKNGKGMIWMKASASRIGTSDWNQELSQTRAGRIVDFLMTNGIGAYQIQSHAVGSDEAQSHGWDDERDRGVLIWVYPRFKLDPPPRRRIPPIVSMGPTIKFTTKFKIAMVVGLDLSGVPNAGSLKELQEGKLSSGMAVDLLFFLIWDYMNGVAASYYFLGVGAGAGVKGMPSISATTIGPWTAFTTEKPMACWQFGDWGRFTSAGAGDHTVNWVTIATPDGIDNVEHLAIDTGTTYGAGATSTIGIFERLNGPFPYVGLNAAIARGQNGVMAPINWHKHKGW